MHSILKFLLFASFANNLLLTTAEIATANNQFGLKLYSALAKKVEGDFIISPFPLSTIFALLISAGDEQRSKTVKELKKLLKYSETISNTLRDYQRIVRDFEDIDSLKNVQTIMFAENTTKLTQDFLESSQNLKISQLSVNNNSKNNSTDAVDKLYSWASPKNKIETFKTFLEREFDASANFGLLSKSYFKGGWSRKFSPFFTKPSPFFYDESHSDQVEMMFQRAEIPFADLPELDATAVALPYKLADAAEGESDEYHRIELIFLLPNNRTGLQDLETKLKDFTFSHLTSAFYTSKDLFLYIPKFNVSSMFDLSSIIFELGIESLIIPEQIDLQNVFQNQSPKISNIFHLAQFSVDEIGSDSDSKIAGPTYVRNLNPHSPQSFRVNRPFIGFLYDQEKHIILNIFRKTM